MLFLLFIVFDFPTSTLELKNKKFGPQIRILREVSSLEPAPKVWKPKSRFYIDPLEVFKDTI